MGLDPQYNAVTDSYAASALALFKTVLGYEGLTLDGALLAKQKQLTEKLDTSSWRGQLNSSTLTGRALLLSESDAGARAFLTAVPRGITQMEPAVFVVEVSQRLGLADAASDGWCPLCDGVLDRHSYHASTCVAGGERSARHNSVRDRLCWWA